MSELPTKVDLYRSLGTLSSEKLKMIRGELEAQIIGGEFHSSVSESGRSISQELLASPHDSLRVVFGILAKRGELSKDEIDRWNKSQPKTKIRINFLPTVKY